MIWFLVQIERLTLNQMFELLIRRLKTYKFIITYNIYSIKYYNFKLVYYLLS